MALQAVLPLRIQIFDEHAEAGAVLLHMRLAEDLLRCALDRLKQEQAFAVWEVHLTASVIRFILRGLLNSRH